MVSIPGLDNINWMGAYSSVVGYLGWGLLIILIFGAFVLAYVLMQFKYKVIIRIMGSENSDGTRSVRLIKNDKLREIKKNGIVESCRLFKSKVNITPLDYRYIYPKNIIFLDQLGPDTFVPTPFNEIKTYDLAIQNIKQWEQMEIKRGAEDYVKKQGWDKYKDFALTLGVVLLCMVIVGVTIYLSYKYHAAALGKTDTLVQALNNFASNPQIGPH